MDHAGHIELTVAGFEAERTEAERPAALAAAEAARTRAWAEQAAEGDRESFDALVGAHQDRLYRFLLRITGSPEDAEDLAQDTFIKVFLALRRGTVPDTFCPWLFTIARRTALNHRRSQRPSEPIEEALATASADDPATAADVRDAGERLWGLARRLPPRHYELLWLRYGEGFSVAEVARITGSTQIGVKVCLHRARRKLAAWLARADRAENRSSITHQ